MTISKKSDDFGLSYFTWPMFLWRVCHLSIWLLLLPILSLHLLCLWLLMLYLVYSIIKHAKELKMRIVKISIITWLWPLEYLE